MNIFHKVTLASLKKNKVRTVVTIVGIILSAAMICAVTTFASSFQNFVLENYIYTEGSWHGSVKRTDRATLETVSSSEEVEKTVYSHYVGYAKAEGSKNEYKPYLYLIGVSEGFDSIMPVHVTSGRYPTSAGEILLPEHLWDNGGVNYKLGDTLNLEIGDRMMDGDMLIQHNPYNSDGGYVETEPDSFETLEIRETRGWTVVGFYERPSFESLSAPGYTAITLAEEPPSTAPLYDVYFQMRNARDVYTFSEDHQLSATYNTDLLIFSGVARYDSYYTFLYSLSAIVIGLIMFGSVSLIYNAFSISVSERTKQFGLLSSVGATKKQLRKMVFFEAFAVSIIGIPIGIIAGIGGIGVTLMILGNKFLSFGNDFVIPMRVCVSPVSVVIACVVALVTVLISAWIPSKRAMRVSAVEAIRQTADIKAPKRLAKTSKITYKLFGLSGVIASKHFKRNRKKYRSTVVSLFMSIVLFVSAAAFSDYLMRSVGDVYDTYGYDIQLWWAESEDDSVTADQLLSEIQGADAVKNATYHQQRSLKGFVPKDCLTSDFWENIYAYYAFEEEPDPNEAQISIYTYFVEDVEYRKLLKEYGLSEKQYTDPENPLAIALDGNTTFSGKDERFVTVHALKSEHIQAEYEYIKTVDGYEYSRYERDENGKIAYYLFENLEDPADILKLTAEEAFERAVLNVGDIIYERPWFCNYQANVTLIYPRSVMTSVLAESVGTTDEFGFVIISDDHEASYAAIEILLKDHQISTKDNLIDYAANVESTRNLVTIIRVFSYGFIVLISLIAAANVFNTISTNISLRRREFAMLKSVGMTQRGFNKMMNYECLLYGSKALLLGLPVSVGITYLIYLAYTSGGDSDFRLPWLAIGIAVLSVFAVVFATMMYSMRKIKRDNPIDALKNENL